MTDEELEAFLKERTAEESILKFFSFSHLRDPLKAVSREFAIFAREAMKLPRSAERAAGLRKLLEAKDCLVRAALP